MPPRAQTSAHHRDQLNRLAGEELLAAAVEIMHESRDLDIVRRAITVIGEAQDPSCRDDLTAKYDWCDAQPTRRDGGGYIRAAIVRALKGIAQPVDTPFFHRAMLSYEIDGAMELCGDLRAIGLLAMNEVDPDLAACWAARFLHDSQITFSGEPTTSAIRLLASHGNLAPVFGLVSWGNARSEVIAEGLRSLAELADSLVPMLVDEYIESDNEQILLGLFDLLLAHRTRDQWRDTIERWFRTTTVMDLYGVVALQIIGSRSEPLIGMLRDLRTDELDPLRQQLLDQALALA